MLSYRHLYHAGNFADVVKHVALVAMLTSLRRKEKPFFYMETHSGAGRYDLRAPQARKNREFDSGIGRIWGGPSALAPVGDYLAAVAAVNGSAAGRSLPPYYPGSPRIARHFLRPGDRMVLAELHSNEVRNLQREFAGDAQVQVVHEDGYGLLKSRLPPQERRGMVLIDPAYEVKDEASRLVAAVREGHRRWATGVYAIWYPIQQEGPASYLKRELRNAGIPKVLLLELCIEDERVSQRLNGTGMLIVNPPWPMAQQMSVVLPWLWQRLGSEDRGRWTMEWLVPE